jgi:hypothetical protein
VRAIKDARLPGNITRSGYLPQNAAKYKRFGLKQMLGDGEEASGGPQLFTISLHLPCLHEARRTFAGLIVNGPQARQNYGFALSVSFTIARGLRGASRRDFAISAERCLELRSLINRSGGVSYFIRFQASRWVSELLRSWAMRTQDCQDLLPRRTANLVFIVFAVLERVFSFESTRVASKGIAASKSGEASAGCCSTSATCSDAQR